MVETVQMATLILYLYDKKFGYNELRRFVLLVGRIASW